MIKRIFAMILLLGFILLLVNILFIGYYRIQSLAVYAVVAVAFLFSMNMFPKNKA